MNIYLIRHGLTTPGEEGRYQGFLDESLSDKGRAQLAEAPQKPSHVYVSPAKRARETASILFPGAGQICVPGLWEMNFGIFEGRTWKEMENDASYREWVDGMCLGTCPGGESRASFSERVCRAFQFVLDTEKKWQKKNTAIGPSVSSPGKGHLEEDLFIVSHGGTQMAILERWGRPARDYYSWQCPCGCGWKLSLKEPEKKPAGSDEQKAPEPDIKFSDDCEKNPDNCGKNTDDCGKSTDNCEKKRNECGKNTYNSSCMELLVLEEVTLIH